jgi:hypothetical protein
VAPPLRLFSCHRTSSPINFAVTLTLMAPNPISPFLSRYRTPPTTYANPIRIFGGSSHLIIGPSSLVGTLMSFRMAPAGRSPAAVRTKARRYTGSVEPLRFRDVRKRVHRTSVPNTNQNGLRKRSFSAGRRYVPPRPQRRLTAHNTEAISRRRVGWRSARNRAVVCTKPQQRPPAAGRAQRGTMRAICPPCSVPRGEHRAPGTTTRPRWRAVRIRRGSWDHRLFHLANSEGTRTPKQRAAIRRAHSPR